MASMEQKKMIACQLFKRIEVGRDYAISHGYAGILCGLCGSRGWKPCRDVLLAQRMYGRLRTGLIRRRRGRLE